MNRCQSVQGDFAVLVEDLDEQITVRADFSSGSIKPQAFKRAGRLYRVDTINAHWIERQGTYPFHCFSVEVGDETCFLRLKTEDMTWTLTKIVLDG